MIRELRHIFSENQFLSIVRSKNRPALHPTAAKSLTELQDTTTHCTDLIRAKINPYSANVDNMASSYQC